jgi:hypothetical protein
MKAFAGMVDLLFSKRAGDAEVDQHAVKMVFESLWAAFEAHVRTPAVPAFVLGVPSLVIAATERSTARKRTWSLLQTGPGARRVADFIVDWFERKRL